MKPKTPLHQLSPRVHLERAHGYFELQMFKEAEIELRGIPEEMPWSKQKRVLLTFLHQEKKEWAQMREKAKSLRIKYPEEEDWWVSEAYATRRANCLGEARKVLLEGLALHYESALIRYNLACYACLMGSHGECLDFLKEAIRRDQKFKELALNDEDLMEVRPALINMGWEKTKEW